MNTFPSETIAAATGWPVISTDKLSKSFSVDGVQQHVLKNLDLEIATGEFTVIMGPSGAGKSTLMYLLSGMDRPTLGRITFADEVISGYSADRLAKFRRHHCSFVFQQVHLLDWLSAFDNAMTVGLLAGRPRHEVAAKVGQLFDQVGLDQPSRDKLPSMLSGGEAQRAALVRALINEPAVLFADEPTGQLNSSSGAQVLDLLSAFVQAGQTAVLVTHEVRTALRGDRILYLRDGTIQGELRLGRWASDDPDRQDSLTSFLARMGW